MASWLIQQIDKTWDVHKDGRIFRYDLSSEEEAIELIRLESGGRGSPSVTVEYADGYRKTV